MSVAKPSIAKVLNSDLTKTLFSEIKTVLFDADGVLWEGSKAIPGAVAAFNKLISMGKRVIIVTNNSTKTRAEYGEKCASLGFNVSADDVISTSFVTAWYLSNNGFQGKKVYVMGTPALVKELDAVGIRQVGVGLDQALNNLSPEVTVFDWARKDLQLDPEVEAVVVGFDPHLNLAKLIKTTSYVMGKNLPFIATNEDQQLPLGNGVVFPGTGALVAAVACAVEKQPDQVMGKPHQHIFKCLQELQEIDAQSTVMIGDRLNTDIAFGSNNGLRTILVLTGCSSLEDVVRKEQSDKDIDKKEIPTFYAESVGAIGEMLA